jgi:predicted Fe-S protein YdhL (DUF1289 family)
MTEVPSPCISQCKLDLHRVFCISCERTLEEIVNWAYMSNEQRQTVLERIKYAKSSNIE